MPGIFISYRRDDSAAICDRICERLTDLYGAEHIFRDKESIEPGTDYRVEIEAALASASVTLVLIGPKWTTITDSSRKPRLFEPNDLVRNEVEFALNSSNMLVIPVLLQGTSTPSQRELPASIARLAALDSARVRLDPDFDRDMLALVSTIGSRVHTLSAAQYKQSIEFTDRQSSYTVPMLALAALKQGKFELFARALGINWPEAELLKGRLFSMGVPWPKSIERMWQACLSVDPHTERLVGHVRSHLTSPANYQFHFVSANFRVKVECINEFSSLIFTIASHGTMVVSSPERHTIDTVIEKYQRLK